MLIINTIGQAIYYYVYSSNTLIKEGMLPNLKLEEIPLSDSDFHGPHNGSGVVTVSFNGGPIPNQPPGNQYYPLTTTVTSDQKDAVIQFSLIAPV